MPHSEMLEWADYFENNPSIQELQMARLIHFTAMHLGVKDARMTDYMVTRTTETAPDRRSIDDLSVEEINRIAGVA